MKNKRGFHIIRVIVWAGILFCACFIIAMAKPGWVAYLIETNPQKKVLLGWLNKRDPGLFKQGKVMFDINTGLQDVPMQQEGDYSIISAILRGNDAKFWINTKTKQLDCYISYCGKNVGHKYCGDEIADKLCEQ